MGRSRSDSARAALPECEIVPLNQAVDALGGFSIDEGGNLFGLPHPFGGSLFGFEQLLHGHRLVDMILGLGDLFAGDQKPQVLL